MSESQVPPASLEQMVALLLKQVPQYIPDPEHPDAPLYAVWPKVIPPPE